MIEHSAAPAASVDSAPAQYDRSAGARGRWLALLILLGITAAGLWLRTYHLMSLVPGIFGDEANTGLEALKFYHDPLRSPFTTDWATMPSLYADMLSWFFRLLGPTPLAVRLFAALWGVACLPLLYLVARELGLGRPASLISTALMAGSWWHVQFSRIGFNNMEAVALELLLVWTLVRAWRRVSLRWFAAAGVVVALLGNAYIGGRIMGLVLAAWAVLLALRAIKVPGSKFQVPSPAAQAANRVPTDVVHQDIEPVVQDGELATRDVELRTRNSELGTQNSELGTRNLEPETQNPELGTRNSELGTRNPDLDEVRPRWRHVLGAAILVVVALVGLAPLLHYYLTDRYALTWRTNTVFVLAPDARRHWLSGHPGESTSAAHILWSQTKTVLGMFTVAGDGNPLTNVPNTPELDPLSGVLFVAAVIFAMLRWRRPVAQLLLPWLGLTLVVGGILTIDAPDTMRLLMLVPSIYLLIGYLVEAALLGSRRRRWRAAIVVGLAVVCVITGGLTAHKLFVEYPGTQMSYEVWNPREYQWSLLANALPGHPLIAVYSDDLWAVEIPPFLAPRAHTCDYLHELCGQPDAVVLFPGMEPFASRWLELPHDPPITRTDPFGTPLFTWIHLRPPGK